MFVSASYEQSSHLFSFLQSHAEEIAHDAALAIANCGMALTEQQQLLMNDIFEALSSGQKYDFIVQGGPGSGKTLLAVSLLLKAAENKYSCIFALRNNRLMKILRNVLDHSYPGVSGMMRFFKPMTGGLVDYRGHVDLLICDEAQRIDDKTIYNAPSVSTVSAIFLDESQRLNPREFGSMSHFRQASQTAQKTPVERELSSSIRCYGGVPYHAWMELLLTHPADKLHLRIANQPWFHNYPFEVIDSILSLKSRLLQYQGANNRVALVASFTESPGVSSNPGAPDNLRIGYPLASSFSLYKDVDIRIPWLMSPDEYSRFWLGGQSNKLDMIASIYGAQGFESDYVGVIWGRDLIYRDGHWALGNPAFCYDNIDRLVSGKPGRSWCDGALDLVINRYRIFLTRGIKGTLVFCEDEETRNHLLSLAV
jgi:uncharacterized protein